jgi:hypothetical protein
MRLLILIAPVALSACASIVEGSTQTIAINTTPAGADCSVMRGGLEIGRVSPTPGEVTIERTKQDLEVMCRKSGYEPVSFSSQSDFAAPFFGNILIGGPVGMGVDLATGAYNKYDAVIAVDFEARSARGINPAPREQAQPAPSPAARVSGAAYEPQPASERILTSEHADRYQARRQQLRKQR